MVMNSKRQPIRWVHNPFTFEHQGVKVSCDKDGKVTLEKEDIDGGVEGIDVPASVIIKTYKDLRFSRRAVPFVRENPKIE